MTGKQDKYISTCCGGPIKPAIGCPDWVEEAANKRPGRNPKVVTNYYVCDNPECDNYGRDCNVQTA